MKTGIITTAKTGLFALGVFGMFAISASAAYFNTAPAPICDVQITRTLQNGSEGVEVIVLQNFLNRAGLLSATPNGYFGPATTAAVRAFQYQNGITGTGTVGASTRNAINERMCDTDLTASSLILRDSSSYGYSSGVTYVDAFDPYVRVVSPPVTTPVVYTTPQNGVQTPSYTYTGSNTYPSSASYSVTPATTNGATTNIVYSPYVGYTYGITPATGSLTISTPVANSIYNEGDTVSLAWTTNNLNATGYAIVLENIQTGLSKTVANTSSNSASFILTKDALDAVCGGSCNDNQQGNFRIVITTPIADMLGKVTTFRAAVAPVTIKRPTALARVSISASKTPVNSSEVFKLYVNIPTAGSSVWNGYQYGSYSFKIKANCQSGVQVSIAGTPCGQEFSMPVSSNNAQQEVPVMITNGGWYKQDITFVITAVNSLGQVTGTADTVVSVNATPFNW